MPRFRAVCASALLLVGTALSLSALAAQEPPLPIAEAKSDRDRDGIPDRSTEVLTVEGVVTFEPYSARGGSESRAYVEDDTGGLLIVAVEPGTLGDSRVGSRIRATGRVEIDRGIERLRVLELRVLGQGPPPEPLSVSLTELQHRAYALRGRLVRVTGEPRQTSVTGLVLEDEDGEAVIHLRPAAFREVTATRLFVRGGVVEAMGVLELDPADSTRESYRITPRSPADVRLIVAPLRPETVPTDGEPGPLDIRATVADGDGDGYPDRLGDSVSVEGVLTYEPYTARGGREHRAYLQDPTGGVRLLAFGPEPMEGLERWHRVRIAGTVTQNNGMPMLLVDEATALGSGQALEPLTLTLAEAIDSAEVLTGRLVRVRGRPVFLDDDVRLSDGEVSLRLYLRSSAFPDDADQGLLRQGTEIEAIGLIEQNSGSSPPSGSYRITPRGPEDLSQTSSSPTALILGWSLAALLLLTAGFGLYVRVSRSRARAREALLMDLKESEAALLASQADLREEMAQKELAEEARRHAELQLLQSQKMESLGTLAGGIAHDFNNLLTVMLGHVDLLLDTNDLTDDVTEDVGEIQKAGERARDLVRQILAFSRRQVLETKQVHLDDFVESDRSLLRRLLREDVELRLDLASNAHVSADTTQLTQVLVNLAANARDAMPRGGTLTIRTSTKTLVKATTEGSTTVPAGRYVVLEVADTGVGMDESTLARAFDPFYTTKEVGAGTGLGLATVHGIVTQSDGHLTVESNPGEGARFRIYLPSADPPPTPALTDTRSTKYESVLLVEDEELVRKITSRMLGRIFDEVLEATDGKEALRVIESRDEPVDLVVTDAIMPGMGGLELAAHLAEVAPDLPVLLLSGYPDPAAGSSLVDPDSLETLMKPVSLASLSAKVTAVLER